jgi:hypothetical protein
MMQEQLTRPEQLYIITQFRQEMTENGFLNERVRRCGAIAERVVLEYPDLDLPYDIDEVARKIAGPGKIPRQIRHLRNAIRQFYAFLGKECW